MRDMADEQSHNGVGELRRIIITGLFGAIIFGPIGYFINDYLAKDNIKIEQVNFIPDTKHFYLSTKDYDELVSNTSIDQYSARNYRFDTLLRRATYEEEYPDHTGYYKTRHGVNKRELDTLISHINNFISWKKISRINTPHI
jgi:hypothetical protein